jgi:hypothetical protein
MLQTKKMNITSATFLRALKEHKLIWELADFIIQCRQLIHVSRSTIQTITHICILQMSICNMRFIWQSTDQQQYIKIDKRRGIYCITSHLKRVSPPCKDELYIWWLVPRICFLLPTSTWWNTYSKEITDSEMTFTTVHWTIVCIHVNKAQ